MYEKELEKILKEAGAELVGFSSLGENRSPEHPEYGYAVTIVRKLSRCYKNNKQRADNGIFSALPCDKRKT